MIVYVATPYSLYADGINAAARLAADQTALILSICVAHGATPLSPIAHSHEVAKHWSIDPYDSALWEAANRPLIAASVVMVEVRMRGWQESRGMAAERAAFRAAGKPVLPMVPGVVPEALAMTLRRLRETAA